MRRGTGRRLFGIQSSRRSLSVHPRGRQARRLRSTLVPHDDDERSQRLAEADRRRRRNRGPAVVRRGSFASGETNHGHHPVAARHQRGWTRQPGHRPADIRSSAGAGHLHPLLGDRHPACRGRIGGLDPAHRGRGCRQEWPLRARQQGHDRGRLPRFGRGGGAALGRRRRCVQCAARLGRRRRRGGGLRRHTRRRRDPFRREEASSRRDLHRPEDPRPTRAVGPHRHRHPVHHGALGHEEDRDGPRCAGCPGRHTRAGGPGSAQSRGARWSTGALRSPGSAGTARG